MVTNVSEILKAARKASQLTRQLLAFSRKQILQPRVISLNPLLVNIEKMLKLVVGENVEVIVMPGEGLGYVKADPGQIEQVIMNLVVNARDAMPNGGNIILSTANISLEANHRDHLDIETGRYIVLSVTDTGSGMEADTQSHIFEPFFTTKEFGRGTGLGLSTVYGIVKQSGGYIEVVSEIGGGTTFQIYLPRIRDGVVAADLATDTVVPEKAEFTQTILLVEDDEMVRTLARACLESSGYLVLDAASGKEAIVICREHVDPIHLMLTDVVMPQMSGGQLAEQVAQIRPDTRVLFMSGYTDKSIVDRGVLNTSIDFIAKPFTPDKLALKVAEVLQRV